DLIIKIEKGFCVCRSKRPPKILFRNKKKLPHFFLPFQLLYLIAGKGPAGRTFSGLRQLRFRGRKKNTGQISGWIKGNFQNAGFFPITESSYNVCFRAAQLI